MAKQRLPAQPLQGPPPITPRATPVDTFHRPDVAMPNQGPNEMTQLAEALGKWSPVLANIATQNGKEARQGEFDSGKLEADRYSTRKALKEAVDKGLIPAARNPDFRAGMEDQSARIMGRQYDEALRESYAQSNTQHTEDITSWIGGFHEAALKKAGIDPNDRAAAQVLAPLINQSHANLAQYHRAKRDQVIAQEALDNTYQEVQGILSNQDAISKQHAEFPYVVASPSSLIKARVDDMVARGMNGTQANRTAIDAVADYAMDHLDNNALAHLHEVDTGNGSLGSTQYGRDKIRSAENYIFTKVEENDRKSATNHVRMQKIQADALKTEGSDYLRTFDFAKADEVWAKLNEVDPDEAAKFDGWKQARITNAGNHLEDNVVKHTLTTNVYSGFGNVDDINDAWASGKITDKTAEDLIKNVEKNKDFRSPLRDPVLGKMYDRLGQSLAKTAGAGEYGAGALISQQGQTAWLVKVAQYRDANPTKSDADINAYAQTIFTQVAAEFNPTAAEQAGSVDLALSPRTVFLMDPSRVEWESQPIFKPDELKQAAAEYDASRGTSGILVQMAGRLSTPEKPVSAKSLLTAQKLLAGQSKATPTK